MDHHAQIRASLANARRIVLKFGTRVLVAEDGRPDPARLEAIADAIATLRKEGRQVIVVTSGAVGAGIDALGLKSRPKTLPGLQMAASVGQARLMALYTDVFRARGLVCGQMLLTADDLKDRVRHLNARNTLNQLLQSGVVPVINENDVVSVAEIKLGDNDKLAALVSLLADADVMFLMTSVAGLLRVNEAGVKERIPHLNKVDDAAKALAVGKGSALSTGGMATKLEAAGMVAGSGAASVIADGRDPANIVRVLRGEDVGTLIGRPLPARSGALRHRKQWIRHFHKSKGRIIVDDGARDAIIRRKTSLLPIGIQKVEGPFPQGALVDIAGTDGTVFARGLVEYESELIHQVKGRKTSEYARQPHLSFVHEVVNRDNLVLTDPSGETSP